MREAGPEGFGRKVRERNSAELLTGWREGWAEHVNTGLAELDTMRGSITARWRRRASRWGRSTKSGRLARDVRSEGRGGARG